MIEIGRGGASKTLMQHFIRGDNLGLGAKRSRYIRVFEFKHAFVTTNISDVNFLGDQTSFFPLYLYRDDDKTLFEDHTYSIRGKPNFTKVFSQTIRESPI